VRLAREVALAETEARLERRGQRPSPH
jgi:hypothetical protein